MGLAKKHIKTIGRTVMPGRTQRISKAVSIHSATLNRLQHANNFCGVAASKEEYFLVTYEYVAVLFVRSPLVTTGVW